MDEINELLKNWKIEREALGQRRDLAELAYSSKTAAIMALEYAIARAAKNQETAENTEFLNGHV